MATTLIDAIAHQEKSLVFTKFDESMAWLIGTTLHEKAVTENWPLVIDIRLFHRPLFFVALPGSTPHNVEYARRKRNVVERFHRSSYADWPRDGYEGRHACQQIWVADSRLCRPWRSLPNHRSWLRCNRRHRRLRTPATRRPHADRSYTLFRAQSIPRINATPPRIKTGAACLNDVRPSALSPPTSRAISYI